MLPRLPAVLGNGVGGTIAAVGGSVGRDLIGARVLATAGGTGGYAELAAVPAAAIITIVAAAGGEPKLAVARSLGTDLAVDYTQPSWTSEIASALSPVGTGLYCGPGLNGTND